MKPVVSIIMGITSDMPVMKKAAEFLNDMEIPFEKDEVGKSEIIISNSKQEESKNQDLLELVKMEPQIFKSHENCDENCANHLKGEGRKP